jgi:molybdate transport system permease protein
MNAAWTPLWLNLRIAGLATVLSAAAGLWLAWILVNREFPGKRAVSALASLALAIPAPVICCYLFWSFTLPHAVGAGILSAAPIVVRVGRTAFTGLDPLYAQAARSLGASDWRVFARVELPLAARAVLAAVGLGFARVAAELAVVGMVAHR